MKDYFGGTGTGKGWYSLPFLISPDELKSLFNKHNLHLIISNRRVSLNYNETRKEDYLIKYSEYVEKTIKSSEIKNEDITEIFISLTKDKDIIKEEVTPNKDFKLLHIREPVIDIKPLSLYYHKSNEKDILLINCGGIKENVANAGLIMSFPKTISYSIEKHKDLHKTSDLLNFRLYREIVEDIKKITVPLIIKSQLKERKTKMRVSKIYKDLLNQTKFFQEKKLEVL